MRTSYIWKVPATIDATQALHGGWREVKNHDNENPNHIYYRLYPGGESGDGGILVRSLADAAVFGAHTADGIPGTGRDILRFAGKIRPGNALALYGETVPPPIRAH